MKWIDILDFLGSLTIMCWFYYALTTDNYLLLTVVVTTVIGTLMAMYARLN